MDKETRILIVEHAARWASNILVEVLSNHGEALPEKARLELREVVSGLGRMDSELRRR